MIGVAGRQDAARGAAGKIALEAVALLHAAAMVLDQAPEGDPGRRDLDAGLFDPAGDGEGAKPLAPVLALACEPLGAALDDVADPVQRLDIVDERRPAEEPDLGGRRRLGPRQGGLALQ